jgi:DNA polymerase/3'-5' exonuclease PolX
MRGYAKSRGLRLNQAGLFRVGTGRARPQLIPTRSEEELFEIVGIKYVPPEQRNSANIIPLENALPQSGRKTANGKIQKAQAR